MGSHKPDGYTTVSPYLIVDGASRTIEFLQNALGAVELRRGGVKDAGGTMWWIATKME